MSFGFFRSEILGALFSILIIWLLTGILVYLAIMRIITRDFEIEPLAMVVTASCGVVFNVIMFVVLDTNLCFSGLKHHGHSHDNDDDHAHSHAISSSKQANHGHSHGGNHNESSSQGAHNHSHSGVTTSSASNVIDCSSSAAAATDKKAKTKQKGNINLRAAAIHVIGDFIQSVGVLIAAIIIYLKASFFFII